MPLPVKSFPIYELKLPSSGETIKYRPYLTGEQTLIMMAMEGDDVNEITNTIKQIVSNCVITKPFNVDSLTMIDLEFIMLRLRSKSVANIVELTYLCKNVVGEKVCGNEVHCNVDIDTVEVSGVVPDSKVPLYEDDKLGEVGVIMKAPNVGMLAKHPLTELRTAKGSYKMIGECITAIYDSTSIYDTKKETPEEIERFLMALSIDQFKKITDWLESLPKIEHKFQFTCNKCGYTHDMVLEGLYSFFA